MHPHSVKIDTSSKGKYGRVIFERGGWGWFQELLQALDFVAKKHNSSIANVATKWVQDTFPPPAFQSTPKLLIVPLCPP